MPNPARSGRFEHWLGVDEPFETIAPVAGNLVGDFEHWLGVAQPFVQYVKKKAAAAPTPPPAVRVKTSYAFII